MTQGKTTTLAVIFLLIASFVRLWNLEWNPAWYADEGTHIEIARHLMQGENYYLGITDSYLIAARLPLFEHLLALWFQFIGVSMLSLRILTALIGILSTALLYHVVASTSGNNRFALMTMGLFAIYPQAVIYSRFGFSYNLLTIFILIGLWTLNRYQQAPKFKYLIATCLIFGLGTISDFVAFSLLPPLLLLIIKIRPKHIVIALIALGAPFTIYALLELHHHPDIFLYDLTYTLSRTGGISLSVQIENIIKNMQVLLTETWWIPVGVIGFIWIQPRHFRWTVALFTLTPVIVIGRTAALYNLSAYYMIPLLPFVAIGISAIINYGLPQVLRTLSLSVVVSRRISIGLFIILFSVSSWHITSDSQYGFKIGIEHFLINADEAYQIQSVLADYAKSEDVIISSPTFAWMVDANVTDYQLSSLSQQINGVFFPADLYPDRLAFEVDYVQADYAIIDTLWRDWGTVHMPTVANMLTAIQQWELILQTDTIQVYHNPSK